MASMETLKFTIPEIFSLIGVIQCIYILVYMLFRAGRLSRASIPFLYFLILGTAFFLDFSSRFISELSPYYNLIALSVWMASPPIGVLVIIQVAQISKLPDIRNFWLLLLPIISSIMAFSIAVNTDECEVLYNCAFYHNLMLVFGLFTGGISLLSIWFHKNLLSELHSQKFSKERYWVILAIIISNVFLLGLILFLSHENVASDTFVLARTMLGLAFIYLITTSLFRIYPQSVEYVERGKTENLTSKETGVAQKIERLFSHEKVYQEAAYSRRDLAKELDVSEMQISKIINIHFGKSLPQLLNEFRVEDAKRLLEETDANISVVAENVGFNSMASFNRVFREITSLTPTQYRKEVKNNG